MSSSSINTFYVYGPTGPQGPLGNTGVDGNPGNPGNTGNTGSIGVYYTSSRTLSDTLLEITISDGTTFGLVGSFAGDTYADQTEGLIRGDNAGSPASLVAPLFRETSGGTFYVRGLSAYGSLVASITGPNNEYISIDSIYYGTDLVGNVNTGTLSPREMLYLGSPTTAFGAELKYSSENGSGGLCGAFDFYQTEMTSINLNAGSKILTVGPIEKGKIVGITGNPVSDVALGTTQGIYLDCNAAGTFILKTPIGIAGFTGSFRTNEVNSITVMFESDDVWKFPENVYFEANENYLTCGKNIIGLMSIDAGETWIATVSHRGHGINNSNRQCIPGYLYGSCCYTNPDNTKSCLDYTTKTVCDSLFGEFNPSESCETSCGSSTSVCCSNGTCQEGISVTLCEEMGGSYWENATCNLGNPSGTNEERFCYDPCDDVKLVCCKDGQCLGNYTKIQCEQFLGGRSVATQSGTCEGVDCCDYTTIEGACCQCTDSGYECSQQSVSNCRSLNGTFMGPGKQCNEVSCGCVCGTDEDGGEEIFGSCCVENSPGNFTCTDNVLQSQCTGTWRIVSCGTLPCNDFPPERGICCKEYTNGGEKYSACDANVNTKVQCESECGHWISSIPFKIGGSNPSGGVSTEDLNETSYTYYIDPDQDCEMCALTRPIIVADVACNDSIPYLLAAFSVPPPPPLPPARRIDTLFDRPNEGQVWGYEANRVYGFYNLPPGDQIPSLRDAIIEAFTCPLTARASQSMRINLASIAISYAFFNNSNPCYQPCCRCVETTPGSGEYIEDCSAGATLIWDDDTCQYRCPEPYSIGNRDCSGGQSSTGEGESPEMPSFQGGCLSDNCETGLQIVTDPTYTFRDDLSGCVTPLSSTIRNIKITINNEDSCIPILCDYGCDEYELCE